MPAFAACFANDVAELWPAAVGIDARMTIQPADRDLAGAGRAEDDLARQLSGTFTGVVGVDGSDGRLRGMSATQTGRGARAASRRCRASSGCRPCCHGENVSRRLLERSACTPCCRRASRRGRCHGDRRRNRRSRRARGRARRLEDLRQLEHEHSRRGARRARRRCRPAASASPPAAARRPSSVSPSSTSSAGRGRGGCRRVPVGATATHGGAPVDERVQRDRRRDVRRRAALAVSPCA